jgi:hypothetical protein
VKNKEALELALMTLENDNLKIGNIYVNYDIQKALIKLVKKELEKEKMMKRVMDGIPDMPIKVQDKSFDKFKSFEEFAQSFAQRPQVIGIPKKEWVGLTAQDLADVGVENIIGAIWADAKLREKNNV